MTQEDKLKLVTKLLEGKSDEITDEEYVEILTNAITNAIIRDVGGIIHSTQTRAGGQP